MLHQSLTAQLHVYKTPQWLKALYPSGVWHKAGDEATIYLTFDDGPVPDATPFVLECLAKFNAKATFFCVGENISKHPAIFNEVVKAGHVIGNHTYNHLKGWHTPNQEYIENIEKCEKVIFDGMGSSKKLFRPPYGRISPGQIKILQKEYEIIMWDVLTGDYNSALQSNNILKNIIKSTNPGSIVVFHDSQKALPHLRNTLEAYLDYFTQKGFSFKSL